MTETTRAASGGGRQAIRSAAVLATLFVGLVHALNVPLYAGSSLGTDYRWRMEHGRLTINREPGHNPQGMWIAGNTEGLKWTFEFRYSNGDWRVTVPLWFPLGVCAGVSVYLFAATGRREEGSIVETDP